MRLVTADQLGGIHLEGPGELLRWRDAELRADLAGRDVIDLGVPGDRSLLSCLLVLKDWVFSAFPIEAATMCGQVLDELASLHCLGTRLLLLLGKIYRQHISVVLRPIAAAPEVVRNVVEFEKALAGYLTAELCVVANCVRVR